MMGIYFYEGIQFGLHFAAAAVGKGANAVVSEDSVVARKRSREFQNKSRGPATTGNISLLAPPRIKSRGQCCYYVNKKNQERMTGSCWVLNMVSNGAALL